MDKLEKIEKIDKVEEIKKDDLDQNTIPNNDILTSEINNQMLENLNNINIDNIPKEKKYSTIQEYLEKLLYPSLKIAICDLIKEIKNGDYYAELENEFNHCFFRNKAEILQKQKQLLKLERGDDYSEGDYEYWVKKNVEVDEKNPEKNDREEDVDPDLDDSDVLNLEEEELNKEEEENNKPKFDPINFLVERLRMVNLNKGNDKGELDLSLEGSRLESERNDEPNKDLKNMIEGTSGTEGDKK